MFEGSKQKIRRRPDSDGINFLSINFEAIPQVYAETENHIIVKVPGRRCWVGRGTYQYTSPELIVCAKTDDPNVLEVIEHIEYTRENRREVYNRVKEQYLSGQ